VARNGVPQDPHHISIGLPDCASGVGSGDQHLGIRAVFSRPLGPGRDFGAALDQGLGQTKATGRLTVGPKADRKKKRHHDTASQNVLCPTARPSSNAVNASS